MILTPHLLVGAAIGSKIHDLWIIFILAMILHFLTDRLPHWEYAPRKDWLIISRKESLVFVAKIAVDLLVGLSIVWLLSAGSPARLYILAGAIFSLFPDDFLLFIDFILKAAFRQESKVLKKWWQLHNFIHTPKNKNSPVLGIIVEGIITLLALAVILI